MIIGSRCFGYRNGANMNVGFVDLQLKNVPADGNVQVVLFESGGVSNEDVNFETSSRTCEEK